MAKLRVYELARELNKTNKDLIETIRAMDISVKSHMSTLDEETIAKIKENIFGEKPKEVEVTRVKPTVIRRRRRRSVQTESVQTDVAAKLEESIKEDHAEKIEDEKPADKVVSVEQKHPPKKPIIKKEVLIEKAKIEKEKLETVKKEDIAEPDIEKIKSSKLEPEKEPQAKTEKPSKIKAAGPKKRARKVSKDTPAKIIKLPEPRVEREDGKKKVEKKKKAPVIETAPLVEQKDHKKEVEAEIQPAEKDGKRKKKKKHEKSEKDLKLKDIKWSKKKISFKKKEVIEAEELYTKRKRGKKARKAAKEKKAAVGQKTLITTPKAIKRRIKIDDTITLSDLSRRMGIKANEMIAKLMGLGVMATVNQTIDFETATLVAAEFDYELEKASFEEETILKAEKDDPGKLIERPPVVTIMGHVDHGKTSLLDVIRKTHVTDNEAGGITQHIGAYYVETDRGQIVFLDTPGHEAFTAMRSRGASITDLVILVVAADDGVMPQTIEAINHSKAAKVPIVVAINKIDKPDADPERVQRELAETGLIPEDWGGDTIFVNVSAKKSLGIDELLEMVLLQAELLELRADPDRLATGYIVEAKLDPGRGPVATVLIQHGTLRTGDSVICGMHYGKIRALINDRGGQVKSAGPSMPVEITGLSGVPNAGDELIALSDEKDAKQVSAHRMRKQRAKELAKTSMVSIEKLYEKLQEDKIITLNLIIKADVHGSIEAIKDSLAKIANEEVKINIIHSATGTVTESDVSLASVSDAIIIGFNVRPAMKVQELASEENVDMRFYNIIYKLTEDIEGAVSGMMPSTFKEHILGSAGVRETFHVPKVGTIAGCYVTDGKIARGQNIRLLRDGVVTYEGKIASLRRFKDDVKEVQNGYECGIGIENYNDIKVGDTIECYYVEEIKAEI